MSQPFIFAAVLKRQATATTVTTGSRAGVKFANSIDEVIGMMTKFFVGQGWSVDMIDAEPMPDTMVEQIANHHASFQTPEMDTQ